MNFEQLQLGILPGAGGLPIVVNKQLIGVVGAGGFRPNPPVWSDEICAHTGARQSDRVHRSRRWLRTLPPRREPQSGQRAGSAFCRGRAAQVRRCRRNSWCGGKGAANVFDGNQISLAAAKKIGQRLPRLGGVEGRPDVALHPRYRRRISCTWSAWTDKLSKRHAHRAVESADGAEDAPAHLHPRGAAQEQSGRRCRAHRRFLISSLVSGRRSRSLSTGK